MTPGFPIRAFIVAATLLVINQGTAQANELVEKFFGSYVGSGTADILHTKQKEVRDLDVTVESLKEDGFTLKWITVIRGADGDRTGADVKRREVEEHFAPVKDRESLYVLASEGGLFHKSELPNPLLGEAVRWAAVEGNDMTVYSLAISESGGSELQVYRRTLTAKGMDIKFMRLQDESIQVRMQGTLVRTK
jgi:hypothetical protein